VLIDSLEQLKKLISGFRKRPQQKTRAEMTLGGSNGQTWIVQLCPWPNTFYKRMLSSKKN